MEGCYFDEGHVFKALLIEPDLILTDIMMPKLDGMAMSQIFYIRSWITAPCGRG